LIFVTELHAELPSVKRRLLQRHERRDLCNVF